MSWKPSITSPRLKVEPRVHLNRAFVVIRHLVRELVPGLHTRELTGGHSLMVTYDACEIASPEGPIDDCHPCRDSPAPSADRDGLPDAGNSGSLHFHFSHPMTAFRVRQRSEGRRMESVRSAPTCREGSAYARSVPWRGGGDKSVRPGFGLDQILRRIRTRCHF